MERFIEFLSSSSRWLLPALGVLLLVYCGISLMRRKIPLPRPASLASGHSRLELARWENSIGRSKACDVILTASTVSRFHAVIAHKKNGWVLIDTNSKLGVFINGQRVIKRAYLVDGDKLDFGGTVVTFREAR